MPRKSKKFKGHTVEFDNASGSFKVKHNGQDKGAAARAEVDVSTFDLNDKDGTIIATSSNPTCFWYFYNGQWYVYCC